jgi:hypothetical protein
LWSSLGYEFYCVLPESLINNDVLGDVSKGAKDTRTHELSTLNAVLLYYVVGIPNGGGEVILMAVRNEEVLSGVDLRVLIEAKANLSSLLSIILLLLLGEVYGLHLFNEFVRLLSTFCYGKGSGDNILKGVTLPMAYALVSGHVIGNDKTVGADKTEDTCHDTEGGRAIMRVYDNNLRASFLRGEGIEEVTVGEANAVLMMNSGTLPCLGELSEGVSDFVTFSAESVNNGSGGELTILLGTASGVRGFKNLGATSGDFLISECEHSLMYPF